MGCKGKVKLLVSELFRWWEGGLKITFSADPASRNRAWRQNKFTYRKKLSTFGRIISLANAKTARLLGSSDSGRL